MKTIYLLLVGLIFSGCGARSVKVLDAPWVSMKHPGGPENPKKLVKVGPIEERYCMESWSGSYGLMDEVVKQAEQKYKVDYIADASFTEDRGRPCIDLVGEGYRSSY